MALKERVLAGGRLRILIYVVSQLVSWSIALATIRFLKPEDYGVLAVGAALYVAASVLFNGKVLRRFIATALNRAAVPTTDNLV